MPDSAAKTPAKPVRDKGSGVLKKYIYISIHRTAPPHTRPRPLPSRKPNWYRGFSGHASPSHGDVSVTACGTVICSWFIVFLSAVLIINIRLRLTQRELKIYRVWFLNKETGE